MNALQNLHTHTTYCDGKNTPEEMVLAAIERGFGALGFSAHSYMHFTARNASLVPEDTAAYKAEIAALKKRYEDKIDLFCGLEYEYYSECEQSGYDYLIGSVHYFKIDGKYVGFDRSAEVMQDIVNTHFSGDGMAFAKAYYATLATLPSRGKFDIIGHVDLIAKHKGTVDFFDEDSKAYQKLACEALDALTGKIPFFEVNTGCVARGYRKTPYPAPFLLRELRARGFGAVISSDCHQAESLDCAFDDAAALLESCGFTEKYILTKKGFEAVALR